MSEALLKFSGIEKSFFGVKVLKGVSFEVAKGRTVGIVGENGAGKSTLMNILGGNLAPSEGTIFFNGVPFHPRNSADSARAGIAFIHQELNLFPNLSIAENIFLTRFPTYRPLPLVNRAEINSNAAKWLYEVGMLIPPDRKVEELSAGERQLVEIAKALSTEARLIIFDEPTTSLSARETEQLFTLIARLRDRGIAMIYISHTLDDIFRLADEIVVLRDGEVVGNGQAPTFTKDKLVSLMIGRSVSQLFPTARRNEGGEPLLEVEDLCADGRLHNISFTLRKGEILGIAGLMGAGRSELARVLFGIDSHQSGIIRLEGEHLTLFSPGEMVARGMAFLTENRQAEGLCLDGGVSDNLVLASVRNYSKAPFRWLSTQKLSEAVQRIREVVALDRKTRDSQRVRTLSGGNQQKVVLGKWLHCHPRVLILDEPTRGIDVGAKAEIYRLVHELTAKGTGILVISSELEELIGLCDRILVMSHGRFVDELPRHQFDRSRILHAALGTDREAHP